MSSQFRVTWLDTDASGRIHHSCVFRWIENAEIDLLRSHGLDLQEAIDYPRRHIEVDYLLALQFDDEVKVELRVARVGTSSVTYCWNVLRDGRVAIKGTHTVVRVGADGRPKPVDGVMLRALELEIETRQRST